MEFSIILRELREKRGWNQGELAKASGLTQQAISKLEADQREPYASTVKSLAKALGVSISVLYGEKEPTPSNSAERALKAVSGLSDAAYEALEIAYRTPLLREAYERIIHLRLEAPDEFDMLLKAFFRLSDKLSHTANPGPPLNDPNEKSGD